MVAMNRISHWINGTVVLGTSGRSAKVYNPASGQQSATVDLATAAEVDAAVAVAAAAFPAWRATSLTRRAEVMFNFRELISANRKEIASLVSSEHGKVVSDALGEVARGLENVEFACGVPNLLKGGFSEQVAGGVDVFSIRQPLGVVAGITPFNFPAMVPLWMLANAIACGNTFVLKPSEKDPSASMFLADLLKQAGLPDGVLNVVHGDKESVDAILANQTIAAVSVVGSTPIATSTWPPMLPFPPPTARPANAAWPSRCSLPSAVLATRSCPLSASACPRFSLVLATTRHRRWARSSRASIATRSRRTWALPRLMAPPL
jgi:malonate-semialdehyde dehydrogenase (acetylating) / methylmalonate-semialdehyde dehydrogenase